VLLLIAIDFERAHVCTLATFGLDTVSTRVGREGNYCNKHP